MGKHNDINQENFNESGFATAATNPQPVKFGKPKANMGMKGPNRTRFTPFGIVAGLVSKLALPDNRWRNYLMIQNVSSSDMFVGFGVAVGDDGNNGFLISSGGFYELDNKVPFNSIYITGTAAAQQILVIEGTIDKAAQ